MIPERLVLDAGPLIALLHRSDPDHEEAVRGFRRLAEGGARLFLPMPVLFEVFKWLLFQAGPKAAREGLAKVEEDTPLAGGGARDGQNRHRDSLG